MKLLVYTHEYPPFLGGLATISSKIVNSLSKHPGIEVTALVPGYEGGEKQFDEKTNCRVVRVPLLGKRIVRAVPLLQQLIGATALFYALKKHRPDTVFFITEEAEAAGGIVSIFLDFNSVVRVAGSGIMTCFYGRKFFKRLLRFPMMRLYRNCNKIIAISGYTKSLLKGIGVDESKIQIVYNGVDEKFLSNPNKSEKRSEIRKRLGIEDKEIVLVTVARVLPRKGQDNVIRALPEVVKSIPDIRYVVVGEGRYVDEFRRLSTDLGLEDIVIFTGGVPHDEIMDYLDMSDVFIMANRLWNNKVEGFGNVFIEAAARGLPVIAGNDSGAVEAVSHNFNGYLVDPFSVKSISDAVIKLAEDESRRKKFGENGVQFVSENFRDEKMIAGYINILKEIG